MDKIISLLELQKQARDAKSIKELGFIIANKTHEFVNYKQAVFWLKKENDIIFESISGIQKIDNKTPYLQWLKQQIKKQLSDKIDRIDFINATDDGEWASDHNHLITFENDNDGVIGGLWIESDKFFSDQQNQLLMELMDCYTQSLTVHLLRQKQTSIFSFFHLKGYRKYVVLGLIALFFFPVRLSVTAPIEIVAKNPTTLTMPFDGIVEDIIVKPGDDVSSGDVVATMDQSAIRTEMEQAEQALKMAQSALSRARFQSLREDEKKSDLETLRADIEAKRIDYNFARQKFERSDITSPADGVAIFSDSSALKGKALPTGEPLMIIADPKQSELLIRVPAQSILPLEIGQSFEFFMNASPLKGYKADIISMGYQATPDADGLLSYKIRGSYDPNEGQRIGWQGTAKLKSDWSFLGYALLRRPLIALRNLTGL
jgi:multidrug resistance efflux pump